MLHEEERQAITREIGKYPTRQAVVPEALRIIQTHRGWVSDEVVADIAVMLAMTPAEVDAVATFYSLIYRRPVGRHVILLCDSVSCWIVGYGPILAYLTERLSVALGETTQDGRFTLLPAACLGDCDHAPAMMVDDVLYGNLTPEQIDDILSRHR